ncbi:MAG TPA: HAMP domain-containing sensor histidine kinase [Candidatus Binatia bacterium]|nr:HAMP domain-containing sensor histidine kinase [Candidatus Binatia bacterium]
MTRPERGFSLGLRGRFIAAMLVMSAISSAGLYVTVAQFVEFHENQMLTRTLAEELREFADFYQRDPDARPPHSADLQAYVVHGDEAMLPLPLRSLGAGLHEDIVIDGREYAVGREDVGADRLYLVLDMQAIEDLEARFIALATLCAAISCILAVLAALWLSRLVTRPVSRLAGMVGDLDPGRPPAPLAGEFGDREIGVIAAAFDRYLERMGEFIGREKAFTEDASHELRTPLTVIHSTAQLLAEDGELSALNRERVQRILRGTQQMQSLIEALLFLAREVGGAPAEELALGPLVQEAADSQHDALARKPVTVNLLVEPAMVRAPRGMAACVVNNLLLNAVHFTERGRIDLEVVPGRLTVQDTGIGIPPEDLARIFERRYRGSQSRGLGLGLYLVKRICDRLGWQVRVTSAPGTGTRIDVTFPHQPL